MRKKLLEPVHPGEILLEDFMKPMGISINRLARDIAVMAGGNSTAVGPPENLDIPLLPLT